MKLALTYSAYREMESIYDNTQLQTINDTILSLADDPLPNGAEQACGCFFLEIGDHAILYHFDNEKDVVTVLGVIGSGKQMVH